MSRLIVDIPGQTCNRFFSYLESVSWAVVNKQKVRVIFWDPSLKYYSRLRHNKFISFPFYHRFLINLIGEKKYQDYVFRIFYHVKRYLNSEIVNGWDLRECDVYYPQVKKTANKLFMPDSKIIKEVNTLFSFQRKVGKTIIGVHFRRGDYKEFMGGRFYYEDDTYEALMTQLEDLFKGEVKFFICTNGTIGKQVFDNHDAFHVNSPTVAHDLYALMQCDYIMGPPSTFSGWASLVGNVPLKYIYYPNEIIKIEDFSPLVSNSRFQNGKGIWDALENNKL